MGVLVDYFTADPEQLARKALSGGPGAVNLPYVDCKGWIDELDTLVAEISGRDLSEFGDNEVVVEDRGGAARSGDVSLVVRLMAANSSSRRAGGSLRPMSAGLTSAWSSFHARAVPARNSSAKRASSRCRSSGQSSAMGSTARTRWVIRSSSA